MPKMPNRPPFAVLLMALIGTGLITLALAVFGAALLNLFGAGYASRGSLIAFVFYALLLSLPFAPLSTALEQRYQTTKRTADKLNFFLVDAIVTTMVMVFIAAFDPAVRIPFFAALVTSMIFSCLELLVGNASPRHAR